MLRAAALTLLILVSVAVMLPLVDSSAHNSATPTASRRSHMRHRHSRAWWRRYRARLRHQRAAAAKRKQDTQTARGRNMNAAPLAEADSHNSNHAVVVNLSPSATGSLKNPASALGLPAGWVKRAVGGETKFVLNAPNGQYIGGATFSLVNAHASGETLMTARGNRKLLGGVPVADLRRTVIDKMVAEGGWVINDMSREINGHPVYIVTAQTAASSDGRTPQLSWVFYFTEVEGRIYSLAASSLQEFSDRISSDSAELMASFLSNNRAASIANSQR